MPDEDPRLAPLLDRPEATVSWKEFEPAAEQAAQLAPEPAPDQAAPAIAIPVTGPWVNLNDLHRELRARLHRATADARISSIARVSSGVRTYAEQVTLFQKFGPGRAANPDYIGSDGRKGSKHMLQSDSWRYAPHFEPCACGYAVDVGFWDESNPPWSLLRSTMADHGLRLTVFQPFEPWHFELDPDWTGSVASPPTAAPVISLGSTGPAVERLQLFLRERNDITPNIIPPVGPADGLYGPATAAAVQAWQHYLGIEADGAYGPQAREHTDRWRGIRAEPLKLGMQGEPVRFVQIYLTSRHRERAPQVPDPGSIDGVFGGMTDAAVRGWQAFVDVHVDGIWGSTTWQATDRFDDQVAAQQ